MLHLAEWWSVRTATGKEKASPDAHSHSCTGPQRHDLDSRRGAGTLPGASGQTDDRKAMKHSCCRGPWNTGAICAL